MDNNDIRQKILEYLYQKDENKPRCWANRKEIIDYLNIDERKVDTNVLYLKDKSYLKVMKTINTLFSFAQITSYGKDLVENHAQFNAEFPITITNISNCVGTVIGNSNIQNINLDSFSTIYEEIERKNPEKKEAIFQEIKRIEEELQKETPNRTVIQKATDYLKKNADWIIPSIFEIIKKAFGS